MQQYFDFSHEVAKALQQKKPIIALESTLITHGLPAPHNLETAKTCEAIAREKGVTPATIAIINGKIKIGLTDSDLERLVSDTASVKASTRDIPYIIANQLTAGTTVAATLFCAHRAGLKLFATGGIGGVHRGSAQDISADLLELSRTPVAIICAGAKSILDLPRTLEYLETMSVPVIGYQTEVLPAFYTAKTNHQLHAHTNDMQTLANILRAHWQLKLTSGILVANPIPAEDEIPESVMEPVIETALESAIENNVNGKNITPYILNEVVKATKGKSLPANISLIKNNVKVAAELACTL